MILLLPLKEVVVVVAAVGAVLTLEMISSGHQTTHCCLVQWAL